MGNTSSLVIDRLCDQTGDRDVTVAGFYCDFLAQQEQTIINMIGAILKQVVGRGDTAFFGLTRNHANGVKQGVAQ